MSTLYLIRLWLWISVSYLAVLCINFVISIFYMTIGKFCSVICCCKMYSLLNPTKLNVLAEGNLHQNSKRKYNIFHLLVKYHVIFQIPKRQWQISCIIWLSCCNFGLVVSCRHEDLCTKPNSQIVTVILIQMWRNLYCKFSL